MNRYILKLLSNGQLLLKEEKSGKLLCPSKPSEKVASLIAGKQLMNNLTQNDFDW